MAKRKELMREPTPDEQAIWAEGKTVASQLPIKIGWFTLTKVVAHCKACGKPIPDECFFGRVNEPIEGIAIVEGISYCPTCDRPANTTQRFDAREEGNLYSSHKDDQGNWGRFKLPIKKDKSIWQSMKAWVMKRLQSSRK